MNRYKKLCLMTIVVVGSLQAAIDPVLLNIAKEGNITSADSHIRLLGTSNFKKEYFAEIRRALKDAYTLLGLPEGSSEDAVIAARKKLQVKYHPDRFPEAERPQATEIFNLLAPAESLIKLYTKHKDMFARLEAEANKPATSKPTQPSAGANKIDALIDAWPNSRNFFSQIVVGNFNQVSGQSDSVVRYFTDISNTLMAMPFDNKYTKGTQDNLGRALAFLIDVTNDIAIAGRKVQPKPDLNKDAKELSGLASKYGLGTLGRIGDRADIAKLKKHLSDAVIPAVQKAAQKLAA